MNCGSFYTRLYEGAKRFQKALVPNDTCGVNIDFFDQCRSLFSPVSYILRSNSKTLNASRFRLPDKGALFVHTFLSEAIFRLIFSNIAQVSISLDTDHAIRTLNDHIKSNKGKTVIKSDYDKVFNSLGDYANKALKCGSSNKIQYISALYFLNVMRSAADTTYKGAINQWEKFQEGWIPASCFESALNKTLSDLTSCISTSTSKNTQQGIEVDIILELASESAEKVNILAEIIYSEKIVELKITPAGDLPKFLDIDSSMLQAITQCLNNYGMNIEKDLIPVKDSENGKLAFMFLKDGLSQNSTQLLESLFVDFGPKSLLGRVENFGSTHASDCDTRGNTRMAFKHFSELMELQVPFSLDAGKQLSSDKILSEGQRKEKAESILKKLGKEESKQEITYATNANASKAMLGRSEVSLISYIAIRYVVAKVLRQHSKLQISNQFLHITHVNILAYRVLSKLGCVIYPDENSDDRKKYNCSISFAYTYAFLPQLINIAGKWIFGNASLLCSDTRLYPFLVGLLFVDRNLTDRLDKNDNAELYALKGALTSCLIAFAGAQFFKKDSSKIPQVVKNFMPGFVNYRNFLKTALSTLLIPKIFDMNALEFKSDKNYNLIEMNDARKDLISLMGTDKGQFLIQRYSLTIKMGHYFLKDIKGVFEQHNDLTPGVTPERYFLQAMQVFSICFSAGFQKSKLINVLEKHSYDQSFLEDLEQSFNSLLEAISHEDIKGDEFLLIQKIRSIAVSKTHSINTEMINSEKSLEFKKNEKHKILVLRYLINQWALTNPSLIPYESLASEYEELFGATEVEQAPHNDLHKSKSAADEPLESAHKKYLIMCALIGELLKTKDFGINFTVPDSHFDQVQSLFPNKFLTSLVWLKERQIKKFVSSKGSLINSNDLNKKIGVGPLEAWLEPSGKVTREVFCSESSLAKFYKDKLRESRLINALSASIAVSDPRSNKSMLPMIHRHVERFLNQLLFGISIKGSVNLDHSGSLAMQRQGIFSISDVAGRIIIKPDLPEKTKEMIAHVVAEPRKVGKESIYPAISKEFYEDYFSKLEVLSWYYTPLRLGLAGLLVKTTLSTEEGLKSERENLQQYFARLSNPNKYNFMTLDTDSLQKENEALSDLLIQFDDIFNTGDQVTSILFSKLSSNKIDRYLGYCVVGITYYEGDLEQTSKILSQLNYRQGDERFLSRNDISHLNKMLSINGVNLELKIKLDGMETLREKLVRYQPLLGKKAYVAATEDERKKLHFMESFMKIFASNLKESSCLELTIVPGLNLKILAGNRLLKECSLSFDENSFLMEPKVLDEDDIAKIEKYLEKNYLINICISGDVNKQQILDELYVSHESEYINPDRAGVSKLHGMQLVEISKNTDLPNLKEKASYERLVERLQEAQTDGIYIDNEIVFSLQDLSGTFLKNIKIKTKEGTTESFFQEENYFDFRCTSTDWAFVEKWLKKNSCSSIRLEDLISFDKRSLSSNFEGINPLKFSDEHYEFTREIIEKVKSLFMYYVSRYEVSNSAVNFEMFFNKMFVVHILNFVMYQRNLQEIVNRFYRAIEHLPRNNYLNKALRECCVMLGQWTLP